jgi:uncharacterized membrane protein YuzA (DUF378 family)
MKKPLSILLIVGALVLGYLGFNRFNEGSAQIKLGDLEISAQDKGSKQEAYIYFGLAAVALIAGMMMMRGGKD